MLAYPTRPRPSPTQIAPRLTTSAARSTTALLVEAELLAARVQPVDRAAADRLLEGLRFELACDDDDEITTASAALAELRKLAAR